MYVPLHGGIGDHATSSFVIQNLECLMKVREIKRLFKVTIDELKAARPKYY